MATVTLHLDKGQQMQHKKNRLALSTIEGITSAMTAIILSTAWPPKASDFMLKNHKAFASAHSCIPQRIERFQEMLSKGAEKRFLKLAKENLASFYLLPLPSGRLIGYFFFTLPGNYPVITR